MKSDFNEKYETYVSCILRVEMSSLSVPSSYMAFGRINRLNSFASIRRQELDRAGEQVECENFAGDEISP